MKILSTKNLFCEESKSTQTTKTCSSNVCLEKRRQSTGERDNDKPLYSSSQFLFLFTSSLSSLNCSNRCGGASNLTHFSIAGH